MVQKWPGGVSRTSRLKISLESFVVVSCAIPVLPAFLGATSCSDNTGEFSCFAEAIRLGQF